MGQQITVGWGTIHLRNRYRIRKGLDLPIAGEPEQTIHTSPSPRQVALLAADYLGVRPTLAVKVGDRVLRGQLLFEDKKTPGVNYTAPAAGTVVAIHRGARRAFQSLVIKLSSAERDGRGDGEQIDFAAFTSKAPTELTADEIHALLIESGLWAALRTRPYSKVPSPQTRPDSLFITAMDSHPLAPSVEAVLAGREDDLAAGLACLQRLSEGPTFLCTRPGSPLIAQAPEGVTSVAFAGPHPAGTPGLHIHLLAPADREHVAWHIGCQDVAAIGRLVRSGTLDVERVIALAGPGVRKPRLLRTRIGAATGDLTGDELHPGEQRVVSGSVLGGRTASGEVDGFLGRYHQQITVLQEGHKRELLGWLVPGLNKFSVTNTFLSALLRNRRFAFTTTTNGSPRAMVPIGTYERVMPMDIEPTFLLRALITGDLEQAEQLGCLELDEEDLALCTFVCPGKYEYGPMLRDMLTRIEREG
ncbi:MAG: Na(+)-translocating NADH-quinone reductase subunit A [Gammaproteobacteria bacterium]|jgi:Na+-transporting NADH:ubiquinone oxidoreductase subunit A